MQNTNLYLSFRNWLTEQSHSVGLSISNTNLTSPFSTVLFNAVLECGPTADCIQFFWSLGRKTEEALALKHGCGLALMWHWALDSLSICFLFTLLRLLGLQDLRTVLNQSRHWPQPWKSGWPDEREHEWECSSGRISLCSWVWSCLSVVHAFILFGLLFY